jgi:guanylate kinase
VGPTRGKLFVLSSPSGGGKSTLVDELRKRNLDLCYLVSVTTRPPRKGEKEGEDYFFFNEKTFLKKINEGVFAEWAKVHNYYYGTLKSQLDQYLSESRKVLLDVDVQGGMCLKRSLPEAVLIFILPTSMTVLEKRLRKRGTESEEAIVKRLKIAEKEMEVADLYDFQVINDTLEDTIKEVQTIIEKC